jgi:addiction module HigA family antidote
LTTLTDYDIRLSLGGYMANIKPILPGEILKEEFLIPMGISPYKLAKDIHISATRVSEILKGKRRITVDTALRLSKYFGNSVEFWVGIQADYEIRKAKKDLKGQLSQIK